MVKNQHTLTNEGNGQLTPKPNTLSLLKLCQYMKALRGMTLRHTLSLYPLDYITCPIHWGKHPFT